MYIITCITIDTVYVCVLLYTQGICKGEREREREREREEEEEEEEEKEKGEGGGALKHLTLQDPRQWRQNMSVL